MPLILTYGTLTDSVLMHSMTKAAVDMGVDSVKGYRLTSCFYLTPVQDDDKLLLGVVWQVTEADFKRLDSFEGYPHYYNRKEITLTSGRAAWLYIMNQDHTDARFCPSSHSNARKGYEEHGIDPEQINLANTRTKEEHDAA